MGPAAVPWGAEKGICSLSCVNDLSHCQQTLLMRMGAADVYFGLCHMAAHVILLTPKDDSNLEVERSLAMAPTPLYTKNYPESDTKWYLPQVTQ